MDSPRTLHVFLAGIIQGSLPDTVHAQDYRQEIGRLVAQHLPGCEIFDPIQQYPESLAFDADTARDAFFDLMSRAGMIDVLIAFVPEASMGTAIEMWNAFNAGAVIVTVSPLTANWVVRFLSDAIVPDIQSLATFLNEGRLEKLLSEKVGFDV